MAVTERTADIRRSGFQAAIWLVVGILITISPLILLALGWFLGEYEETAGVSQVSHRVHEVSFGILFALALLGALSQIRDPRRNVSGMQQLLIVTVLFSVVVNVTVDAFEPVTVAYLVPVLAAAALHPARKQLLRPPLRPSAFGSFLVVASVGVAFDFAGREITRGLAGAQDHTTHWGAMGAFFLSLVALGILASLRPPGYRVTAYSVGGASLLYSVASFLFPYDASAHPGVSAVFAALWGAAWIWFAARAGEREKPAERMGRSTMRSLLVRTAKVLAIVVAGVFFAANWSGGDDPPNVPHALPQGVSYAEADRFTCLECHQSGQQGAPTPYHDFFRPVVDVYPQGGVDGRIDCLGCHQLDPALRGDTAAASELHQGLVGSLGPQGPLPTAQAALTRAQLARLGGGRP